MINMNLLKWNKIEEMSTKEYCDYLRQYCMEYKNSLSDMVSVANWRTGHAESLHVNMSMDDLFKRGVCENKIATSYPNKEILNEVLASSFIEYGEEIAKAILTEPEKGKSPQCTMRLKYGYPVGYGIDEVFETLEVEASNTVIKRNRSADLGFMVITSFPDVQTKCGSYYDYSYLNDAKSLGKISEKNYIERKLHNNGYGNKDNAKNDEVSFYFKSSFGEISADYNFKTKETWYYLSNKPIEKSQLKTSLTKREIDSLDDGFDIIEDAIENFKFPTIEQKPDFSLFINSIKLPNPMEQIVKAGFEIFI